MAIKVKEFANMNEFENQYEEEIFPDEVVCIVHGGDKICADLTTKCKSWETAVKRFFKAIEETSHEELKEWKEGFFESCNSGCFTDKESNNGQYTGGWSYGLEFPDENTVYMWLNVMRFA